MLHDHHVLTSPGFIELWQPDKMVVFIFIAVIYFLIIGPFQGKFNNATKVGLWQQILFIGGLFLFYVALGSPLNYYGHHYLFSAHMTQMAIMYLIIPPMLLLGIPVWIYRTLLQNKLLYKLLSFFTLPLVSIILFNMLFSFYHLPFIFDTVMATYPLHLLYHTVLFIGAALMWWPVSCPVPEMNSLSDLKKIGYIFVSGILLTPVCALIVFAGQPLYAAYTDVPQVISWLPLLHDQQLGGVLMKVIQELAYITAITIVFFTWAAKEKKNEAYLSTDEVALPKLASELTPIAAVGAKLDEQPYGNK